MIAVVSLFGLAYAAFAQSQGWPNDIRRDEFGFHDRTPTDVPWKDVQQGCAERDCIPSIDEPRFIDGRDAAYLNDDDIVIAVDYQGEQRAYPTRILDRHEIVNDVIAEEPVAITYCPLCGSGLAYRRTIDGRTVQFGVSGLLHNSDLIMYDRDTESLWQQIGGEAFAGPHRGKALDPFPVTMTTWSQWRRAHPQTQVLSPRTGFMRSYSGDAYPGYEESDKTMFPVAHKSRKLHPKAVVFGTTVNGEDLAFEEQWLAEQKQHRETFADLPIEVTYSEDGSVTVSDRSGNTYLAHRMFWFAWYTFHPETEVRAKARD